MSRSSVPGEIGGPAAANEVISVAPQRAVAGVAELIPGELAAQHVQRAEVAVLLGAGCLILEADDAEDVARDVRLEARVRRGNRHAQLLEHLVAIGHPDESRKLRVLQRLLDLRCFRGQRGSDLHAGSGEHLVDGVLHGVGGIPHGGRVGCLHEARGQCALSGVTGQDRHESQRVAGALCPALVPCVQLGVEHVDGGPEVQVEPCQQLGLAPVGDVRAVEAGDGREDVAVVTSSDLLTNGVEGRGDRLFAFVGVGFHGGSQLVRHVVQADTLGQRGTNCRDDRGRVDLQNAAGLQRFQPGRIVLNGRKQGFEGGAADGGLGDRGLHVVDQLASRDDGQAGTGEVFDGQGGQVVDGFDAEGLDLLDRFFVDGAVLVQLGADEVDGNGGVGIGTDGGVLSFGHRVPLSGGWVWLLQEFVLFGRPHGNHADRNACHILDVRRAHAIRSIIAQIVRNRKTFYYWCD